MRKILSFKDFGLYEYQKFDNSLYNKISSLYKSSFIV